MAIPELQNTKYEIKKKKLLNVIMKRFKKTERSLLKLKVDSSVQFSSVTQSCSTESFPMS